MFNKLSALGKLATETGTALSKVAAVHGNDLIEAVVGQLPDIETLTCKVGQLKESYTAIAVPVLCEHLDGGGPDDYELVVDIDAIATALNKGRMARPQITIYSQYSEMMNRDLLADRMETALVPLLHQYRAHVDKRKKTIEAKRRKESELSFFDALDIGIAVAFFPPIILLLMALDFTAFVQQLPALMLAKFKGDEIAKLDAELDRARQTLRSLIRKMKIEPLPG